MKFGCDRMPYVMDTSALIGAWVRTYPPDIMPGLWEHLDEMAATGDVVAPEEVLFELKDRDDDLYAWVKKRADSIVIPTSREVMLSARDVLNSYPALTKSGTGRGRADPFVIALASSFDCTLVTHEQGGSERKPRIPWVCDQLGISHCAMLDVIREQSMTFRR